MAMGMVASSRFGGLKDIRVPFEVHKYAVRSAQKRNRVARTYIE